MEGLLGFHTQGSLRSKMSGFGLKNMYYLYNRIEYRTLLGHLSHLLLAHNVHSPFISLLCFLELVIKRLCASSTTYRWILSRLGLQH